MMRSLAVSAALILAGCQAATPVDTADRVARAICEGAAVGRSAAEMQECLELNRRMVLEFRREHL